MKKIFSCSMSQVAVEKWNKYDQKLFQAVEKGDAGKVSSILSKKPIKAAKVNPKGQSTFHLAASRGLSECLNILLAHGVDINAINDDGRTALHLAASSCQPECVKLLLQRGANEDAVDFRSRTPLHCAASSGCVSSIIHLCEKEEICIDAIGDDGKTPLMIAAQRNHPTVCSLLLEHGAQVNLTDKEGRTALILACKKNNIQAAEVLLANNANVMTTDCKGHNALYYASYSHDDALRRLLHEPLGNWKKEDRDLKAEGSSQEIVEVLSGDEDWQVLPDEEWRWRYEEEHRKVLYLQAELMRKTQQLESSAVEYRMEKDQIGEQLLEIHGSQQGRTGDQPGDLCHSLEDNEFLDLIMKHEQSSFWGDGSGREKFEEETRKLVKRYQQEIVHLRGEVAAAQDEMESARKRTEELEGHLENMRAVISQFDKRKRTHSSMIEELQEQIIDITSENEKLQALVKNLQGGVAVEAVEDGKIEMSGGITMLEPMDTQAVLDDVIQELKQFLVQMRKEYGNIQWGKQILFKRQMEEVLKSHAQPELEIMVREDFERSATFFQKTVTDLEQLLTELEQKNISLQEKFKQLREISGLTQNEESMKENAYEVFDHSTVSGIQGWEKQLGKPQKQPQKESKEVLQENAVLKDIRKLFQTCASGIQDESSTSKLPEIIQQEEKSTGKIQPLMSTEHESLMGSDSVEMKDTVNKRIAELEKEVQDLGLNRARLLTKLRNTRKERDILQEDLKALQRSLQTDFLPRNEMQHLIEDLEKNFLLLSEELSTEQEATKKLRSKLETQRNNILMLKKIVPKEIIHEENYKEEGNFSTDILEELHWYINTLVRKHDEAVMKKLKLEKENQSLKDDQSQLVSIKDCNELQRSMTKKLEKQASEIQELSWKLSEATKHALKLETELTSQKTNYIPKGEHLQQVSTLDKELTEVKGRLESAKVTVEENCQEITMLNYLLDQASEEIQEMMSREKKCLQQHEKVISSLEKEIQKLKEDHAECMSILDHNAMKTSMSQTIETQANVIQELEDKLTIAIKDQNSQSTLMTHKIYRHAIEIQEFKHQIATGNALPLQKESITQNTNYVSNEKHKEQVTALEKDPTTVKENLDPVRVTIKGTDPDMSMLEHQPDQTTKQIKEMTSTEDKCISSSEKELQKLKNDHVECVSILDPNTVIQTIETQAKVIQKLEDKLIEAMKDVQESHKEISIQKINSEPNKYKTGITLEKDFTEIQKKLPSSTEFLDGECPVIEIQKQRSMEEGYIQDPKDLVTPLEVENQRSVDEIQTKVTHRSTEMEWLKQNPFEQLLNAQDAKTDPLRQKTNYVLYDEHLQRVTALEEVLTEVTNELESDKTKLDRQHQEIVMLNYQLNQATNEIKELKSTETNCLQSHKDVKDGKTLASKPKEMYEEDSYWKDVESPNNENQIKEISELLDHLQKCTEEVTDLRNRNASFQQHLEETQKQHQNTVSIYRVHLLNAAQGFMDGEVYSTLSGILQIQSQMVC